MNLAELIHKVHGLPAAQQAEVLDFVDFLQLRHVQHGTVEHTDWDAEEFMRLSMEGAMRGLTDEPAIYTTADLKDSWG
jgi:hypothetical protein